MGFAALVLSGCREYTPDIPEVTPGEIPETVLKGYAHTDAVLARLNDLKDTGQQLDSLFYYTELLANYDDKAAMAYAKEANRIAEEENLRMARAVSGYYIALFSGRQYVLGDEEALEGAIVNAGNSYQLFERAKSKEWQVKTQVLLGHLNYYKGDSIAAKEYLFDALKTQEIAESGTEESDKQKGEIFHELGNLYYYLFGDAAKALDYFNKSKELYEKTGYGSALARLWLDMGLYYTYQNDYETADSLIQLSIDYGKENRDTKTLIIAYRQLAELKRLQYVASGDSLLIGATFDLLEKCMMLQKDRDYVTLELMGKAYYSKARKAGPYPEIDSAIVYFKAAVLEAKKIGAPKIMEPLVDNISKLCNARVIIIGKDCSDLLSDPSMTFLNKQYKELNDTIVNRLQAASRQNNAFALQLQESENKHRVNTIWMTSGAGLVIAGFIFLILLQRQQQKRLKAKMEALRAQINPHFVSNSLNAIESLVNHDQKDAAAKYIIHFSRLSRQILNSSRDGVTTLAEELKMLEHFMALEQLRFRDKMTYRIEVAPELENQPVELPAMILQPYVENAIWHGIKPKQGTGFLLIKVEKQDRSLICTIEDDGIGREKAREIKAKSLMQHKSVGMQITQERLKTIGHVKDTQVDIIDLYDDQGQAAGTRIVIRLPFKIKKMKPA